MKLERPASLTARLGLLFAIVAAITFAGVGSYLYHSLALQLEAREDRELIERMEHIKHLLVETASVDEVIEGHNRFRDAVQGHEGIIFEIRRADGAILARNREGLGAMPQLPLAPYGQVPNAALVRTWRASSGEEIRLVAAWGSIAGNEQEKVQVFVGRSREAQLALLASYRLQVLFAVLGGTLAAALLGYALLRRGLKPVRVIAAQAHTITAQQLDRRLDASAAPKELQALVEAFNAMLDRLHDSFMRLSQFSADLAHDLRTPINNLMVQTQVALAQARSAEDYQGLLASNIEEYERMTRMMESMLFLARADHAHVALNRQCLELESELQRIADYFEGPADEAGVALAVDASGRVDADPAMFRRAVNNLVANAIRYATAGSTIRLRAKQDSAGAEVAVSNHGDQIDSAHLPRLFDRFYRADPSRHESSLSAGLGLSIVRSVMKLHGGEASVESSDGVTTFRLRFPGQPGQAQ